MDPAAATYLASVEGRLRRAGFSIARSGHDADHPFPLVALRRFGVSKQVGLAPNMVIFSTFDAVDWDEMCQFSEVAHDHLTANHPEFRAGKRMVLFAPVAVVPAVHEATRDALATRKRPMRYKRFASFPVIVETDAGAAHYRAKPAVIGYAYHRGFRRLADVLAPTQP